jgi:hypothetical protein
MSAQNGYCVQLVRRELLEALAAQAPVSPSKSPGNGGLTS